MLGYLDSLNIIDNFWEREFKHSPEGHVSNCALLKWEDHDPLRAVFALQFGWFRPVNNLKDDFERAFRVGMRAQEVTISPSGIIGPGLATNIYPIQLTGLDLQGYGGGFRNRGGLYIGNETDFTDLLYFWNLRAAGHLILFLPTDHTDRMKDLAAKHLTGLGELPDAHPTIEDFIMFYYRQDENRCRPIADQFSTRKRRALSQCHDVSFNVKPMAFYFSWDTCVGSVERSYDRYQVVLPLPEKKFLPQTDRRIDQQQLAVSLQCFSEFEYPGYTLHPPPLRQLNEFYSRNIAFQSLKLRVEQEGVASMTDVHESVEYVYPISKEDLLAKVFELGSIRAGPSKPGLIATRIIEQIGGIEGGRVFKIAGVRKLIQGRRAEEALPHATVLQIIWDESRFSKYEDLFIEARDHDKLRKEDVFNFLLKRDFFRPGLELTCSRCTLSNWLSLRDIDDAWCCQFCGNTDRLSLHLRHRGDCRFRKSGLLAKDNNQEGAIPVILSLLVFKRILRQWSALCSTSLSLITPENNREIDYAIFYYGRENRMEMVIGEAKSAGGSFDENDVANMRSILERLKCQNISGYLAFSKTGEAFADKELLLFKQLRDDGISTILLTNRRLEPYQPYLEQEGERLPNKYALTILDMVQNSVVRYLR